VSESNAVRIRAGGGGRRSARRPPTKWGDREQRRIDILDAARQRITERGYLSLNMRDLAAGAGVSPATLYSYFATKEELFATLYAEAIRAHTAAFRPVADADLDLTGLLVAVIEAHLDLFRSYGRHFTLWSATRHDPDLVASDRKVPRELVAELRTATIEHNRLLMASVRAAASRDGRRVADERLVPSFLWSALNGLADHFTTERGALDPFPPEQLIAFSAARLALAITDPGAGETPPAG
jgi:AcrR family transcriptional regulator